ncbi:MAG: hypothetical protein ACI9VT_002945 [Psychroserpens sp.]
MTGEYFPIIISMELLMNGITAKILTLSLAITLGGCAVTTAKQTYRTSDGEELMIIGRIQAGQVSVYINGEEVISKTSIFSENINGNYGNSKVVAMCKHTKHFASVENECDNYVNQKFAANLYMR